MPTGVGLAPAEPLPGALQALPDFFLLRRNYEFWHALLCASEHPAQLKPFERIDALKRFEYMQGMPKQEIKTVDDVIQALGGVDPVARRFGVGDTAVHNWRAWNRFPPRIHLDLYLWCKELGIDYDPREAAA